MGRHNSKQTGQLTTGQQKMKRALGALESCARHFEGRGLYDQSAVFDGMIERLEDIAADLEALGLPAGVLLYRESAVYAD